MNPTSGPGRDPILGGYKGLQNELKSFFQQAPVHSKQVLDKWDVELKQAQERSWQLNGHTFDRESGIWKTNPNAETKPQGKQAVKEESCNLASA